MFSLRVQTMRLVPTVFSDKKQKTNTKQKRQKRKLQCLKLAVVMEFDAAARQEAGRLAQPQEDPPHAPNERQPGGCGRGLQQRHHHLLGGGAEQQPDTPSHLRRHLHQAAVFGFRTLQGGAQQPHLHPRQGLKSRRDTQDKRNCQERQR